MKINLRKAAAFQLAIREAIAGSAISSATVILSVYDTDIDRTWTKAQDEYKTEVEKVERLEAILLDIRRKVGRANAVSGVSDLLAEEASLKSRKARLTPTVSNPRRRSNSVTPTLDAAKKEIETLLKKHESGNDIYGIADQVVVSLLDDERTEAMKAEMLENKRRLNEIKDQILDLNIKTEIEIADADVTFLREQGVI